METETTYKIALSVEEFKRSRNRILAGNTEEFPRLQELCSLTIEQFNSLSDAHELAVKQK